MLHECQVQQASTQFEIFYKLKYDYKYALHYLENEQNIASNAFEAFNTPPKSNWFTTYSMQKVSTLILKCKRITSWATYFESEPRIREMIHHNDRISPLFHLIAGTYSSIVGCPLAKSWSSPFTHPHLYWGWVNYRKGHRIVIWENTVAAHF